MKTYKSDTAIFYNKDCAKYGVLKLEKAYILNDKQLYHWTQRAIGEKTYTHYKEVARRWARSVVTKELIGFPNPRVIRVDMVNNEKGLLPIPIEFIN